DEESGEQRSVLAERGDDAADDPALDDERRHAGERERETDASLVECEAMCGVQHERDRERVVREVREERGAGETDETAMSAEERRAAKGMGMVGASAMTP